METSTFSLEILVGSSHVDEDVLLKIFSCKIFMERHLGMYQYQYIWILVSNELLDVDVDGIGLAQVLV